MNVFYDRKFNHLLEDTIFFLKESSADTTEGYSPKESALVRSSIYSSVLMLEAASNCCIATLGLSKKFFDDIDKLTVLSKFEYFLQHVNKDIRMDRGSLPVQQAAELTSIRNSIVHPKPYKSEWVQGDEHTRLVDLGKTKVLELPKSLFLVKHEHGLIAFKAAMTFLNHFFLDLCGFNDSHNRSLLISDREYPLPKNVSLSFSYEWISVHDIWGVEVDFLIDVAMVKEKNKEFGDHLKTLSN